MPERRRLRLRRPPARAAAALALAALGAAAPSGDPFRRLERPPFTYLYTRFPPRDLERLAARLEARLPEMARLLGVEAPPALSILLLPAEGEEEFFGRSGTPAPWIQGFAVPAPPEPGGSPLIVVRLRLLRGYPYRGAGPVAEHELAHVLLWAGAGARARALPRWFQEGCAMRLAREWGVGDSLRLLPAALWGQLPPLAALERSFPADEIGARLAYAQSFSFAGYLAESHGASLPRRLLEGVRAGADFGDAFRSVTGRTLADAEAAWRGRIDLRYRWIPLAGSSLTLWGGLALAAVVGYARKRRRAREILRRWDEEEGPPPPAPPGETIH